MGTLLSEDLSPYALAIPFALVAVGLECYLDQDTRTNPLENLYESMANLMIGMTDLVARATSQVLLLLLYILVFEHWHLFTLPDTPWMIPVGIVGYEFFYYWKHRMGHELNLIWASHSVHHQSRVMNFTASVRNSSTSGFWSIPFYLWMGLLGFSPLLFLKAQIISHLWQFFLHTEKIGKLHPWFEYIFNTPSHHRVHHGIEEHYLDKNYGSVFILLDRWFGTFQEEEAVPTYGTTDGISPRNPIRANLGYYFKIARGAMRIDHPASLWRLFFGRPAHAFTPYPGGTAPKSFEQEGLPPKHRLRKAYLFTQFAASALLVFSFLAIVEQLPGWLVALDTAWLVGMLSLIGTMTERWIKPVMVAKAVALVALPCLFWLHLQEWELRPVCMLIPIVFSLGSLVWLTLLFTLETRMPNSPTGSGQESEPVSELSYFSGQNGQKLPL